MKSSKSFLITPRDILEKVKIEFNDFEQDSKSTRHAINFTLTIHHLKEWVWKSYLEKDNELKNKILSDTKTINTKNDYYSLINMECPEIKLIHELANNIKHFYTQNDDIKETTQRKPWQEIKCTWNNFKIPYGYGGLIIINKENQWLSALDVFKAALYYWTIQFETTFQECN
jgi:hypothetical protein